MALSKLSRTERSRDSVSSYEAAAQRLRTAARALTSALRRKAGFNPNQPRLPVGNPEGGQWTHEGGGSRTRRQRPGTANGGNETPSPVPNRNLDEPIEWTPTSIVRRPDGSISARTIVNPDGDAIRSEYAIPADGVVWDERHTVRNRDGSIATFQNAGLTQFVFDEQAQLVSAAVWTPSGPEKLPIQEAAAPLALPLVELALPAIEKTIELGLTLFSGLLALDRVDEVDPRTKKEDRLPVLGFIARDYRRVGTKPFELGFVGTLGLEEVEKACPRMPEVQEIVDRAAASTNRSLYASPALYGTGVHTKVRDDVEALHDPDLKAEVSFLKFLEEAEMTPTMAMTKYGTRGSVRVDVHEWVAATNTACVYDVKTGKSGLSAPRSAEMAGAILRSWSNVQRVIMMEKRPRT